MADKKKSITDSLYDFYYAHYKKILVFPLLLLILAFAQIGYHYATTGDFVDKGISLKGGISITVEYPGSTSHASELASTLQASFPNNEVAVRELADASGIIGYIIESDIFDDAQKDLLINAITTELNIVDKSTLSIESTGPAIGEEFFHQAQIAILIAFVGMALVVYLSFRSLIPSLNVVFAAFSNVIITLAIFNLMDQKLTGAGIAAFLMVLGYSVDSDILLSSRLLKRADTSVKDRLLGAIKTSFLMTATTAAAVVVALIATNSDVIRQIMLILTIGLVLDVIITYCQNANMLRLYLEKKDSKVSK